MRKIAALLAATLALSACNRDTLYKARIPQPHAVGNPHHGAYLVEYYGCGGCHTIAGIPNAVGVVGPPLNDFAQRIYIAGMLRNTPDNLMRWIENPQGVVPGNVMPNMGISPPDARDIAAYLYTRK